MSSSNPVGAPALVAEGLTVQYRGVPAVRGIDLRLVVGEAVGLIGPNGAGKSSTLKALMGVVTPAKGTVRLKGEEITGLAPEAVVRRGLALVPEGRHIFGHLSVSDNLRLGLVGRRDKRDAGEHLSRVFELFPILGEFRRRQAGLLSGGQQQQLAIGRALLAAPDVLMLDEPSLGLSPKAVDTVFEALSVVRAEGMSVLVVEQRAEATIAFAERTYVLHDGRITLELTSDAVHDQSLLEKAYFGS